MAISELFDAYLDSLREAARRGPVVDIACGRGRHALAAARAGIPILGLDREEGHLRELRSSAVAESLSIPLVRVDLEAGRGLPLRPRSCAALLVFRYMHRPLAPVLAETLRPGGLLLYETFTVHQQDLPHGPSNPLYLLEAGELARLFPELETLEFWEGTTRDPKPFHVARLAARRP